MLRHVLSCTGLILMAAIAAGAMRWQSESRASSTEDLLFERGIFVRGHLAEAELNWRKRYLADAPYVNEAVIQVEEAVPCLATYMITGQVPSAQVHRRISMLGPLVRGNVP